MASHRPCLPPPHSPPALSDACLTPPAFLPCSRQLKQVESCDSLPWCVWYFMLCRVLSHLFLITLGGELGNLLALIVQMRKLRLREVKSCVQHHSARILHCSWHYLQITIPSTWSPLPPDTCHLPPPHLQIFAEASPLWSRLLRPTPFKTQPGTSPTHPFPFPASFLSIALVPT